MARRMHKPRSAQQDAITPLAYIPGTAGNDSLTGTAGADTIEGLGGNDTLNGAGGNDLIYGDAGRDQIDGGSGDDALTGGIGIDTLRGGTGNDGLYSYEGEGPDDLDGGEGIDFAWLERSSSTTGVVFSIEANLGAAQTLADGTVLRNFEQILVEGSNTAADSISGGAFYDEMYGLGGADVLYGMAGGDYIEGGVGADTLDGGAGADDVFGGAGNDFVSLHAGEGGDELDGGAGTDYLYLNSIDSNQALYFSVLDNLLFGVTLADGSLIYNFEQAFINGSDSAADTLFGGDLDDALYGYGGDDLIDGGAGADDLDGFAGADTLYGGFGDDSLWSYAGEGPDSLDGGAGIDWLYLERYDATSGLVLFVAANLLAPVYLADGTVLSGIERVTVLGSGTAGDWVVAADWASDLFGGGGADILIGGAGDDVLDGGDGDDQLDGGSGDDSAYGGSGSDTISSYTNQGPDLLDGGIGTDYLYLGRFEVTGGINFSVSANLNGVVTLAGGSEVSGFEQVEIYGSATGADTLKGGVLDDVLWGNGGTDSLAGGGGFDFLVGGAGADTVAGDDGDDTVDGGGGADRVSGGAGQDLLWSFDGEGPDTLDGGSGFDLLILNRFSVSAGISFSVAGNLAGTVALGDGTTITNVEQVLLSGSNTGADTLAGGALGDELYGNGGADSLAGGSGHDFLEGGFGRDTLRGEAGDDLIGSANPDDIDGGSGTDTLALDRSTGSTAIAFTVAANLAGAVTLGDNTVVRNIEQLVFFGSTAADSVSGGALNDALAGGAGADRLRGEAGDDRLDGNAGNDSLDGGAGYDQLWSFDAQGKDTLDGGADRDFLFLDRSSATSGVVFSVAANLAGSVTLGDGSVIRNIEQVWIAGAAAFGDSLTGGDSGDWLFGAGGNDVLNGGGGTDFLHGQVGADTLNGGDGDDYLNGFSGADSVHGGTGNDRLFSGDNPGTDTVDGGSGTDTLYIFRFSAQGIAFTLSDNLAGPVTLADGTRIANIERVEFHGSNSGADTLQGGLLNDTLYGYGGSDLLQGDTGEDQLNGDAGTDTLRGGAGDDRLWSFAGEGPDSLDGGTGVDFLFLARLNAVQGVVFSVADNLAGVEQLADTTRVTGVDRVWINGSDNAADTLAGGAFDDTLKGFGGHDLLQGSGGNDNLDGYAGNDTLQGGDGDDVLFSFNAFGLDSLDGGAGTDLLRIDRFYSPTGFSFTVASNLLGTVTLADGTKLRDIERVEFHGSGTAADTLTGGTLSDLLFGYDGDDSLAGDAGADELWGGTGNDTLRGGNGFDNLLGGEGNDRLETGPDGGFANGEAGADTLLGGSGRETLAGGADNDSLSGDLGDDSLDGWSGFDTVSGGAGNDTLSSLAGEGRDTLDGGTGTDFLFIDRTLNGAGISFAVAGNLSAAVVLADGTSVRNIERIEFFGSATGNDTLTGGALADRLVGNGGNDRLDGSGGNDVLEGSEGNDTLLGSAGADLLDGFVGSDSLNGGADNDTLISVDGEGPDTLDGGAGSDFLFLDRRSSTASIVFSVAANLAGPVLLPGSYSVRNMERVEIYGSTSGDTLTGGALDDTLAGQGGNDSLTGQDGADLLDGGAGTDTLNGGNGDDQIVLRFAEGADSVNGGAGTDTLVVDAAASNAGASLVFASSGSWGSASWQAMERMRFTGSGSGGDSVTGGTGIDILDGAGGNDSLGGGGGADLLDGAEGDDTVSGGTGNDTLDGSGGSDTAVFTGNAADYRFGESLGYLTITDANPADGDDGTDFLTNIETLQFADRSLEVRPGVEFRVNTSVLGNESAPAVAALASGGFVSVWVSEKPDGSGLAVMARRFDGDGIALDEEQQVNEAALGVDVGHGQPVVAALDDGGYVVAWVGADQSGSGIIAKRFTALGEGLGSETVINTTFGADQGAPAIAALADGGFVIAWSSATEGAAGVYVQQFDANGIFAGTERKFDNASSGRASDPEVAGLDDGGFVVTWTDAGGQGGESAVYARRSFTFGSGFDTDAVRVDAASSGPDANSSVAALAGGGFVLVWEAADASGRGIHAQRFDFLGSKIGAAVLVNTNETGDQADAQVRPLADGGFIVTWSSADEDGNGVFAQRFDALGAKADAEFRVNTTGAGEQGRAVVAQMVQGDFVILWQSFTTESGTDGSGIFAKRYGADGSVRLIEIWGTDGDDYLDLRGLGGSVHLNGRGGNDTFVVDSPTDQVEDLPNSQGGSENHLWPPGAGPDPNSHGGDNIEIVLAESDYVLAAYIEVLELLEGAGDIDGTGNESDNDLYGNEGDNVLSGLGGVDVILGGLGADTIDGGAGADTLDGGPGSDVYVVSDASDVILDSGDPGTEPDSILASASWTLGADFLDLELSGSAGLAGTGNTLANTITGNTGANSLNGSSGNDTLEGLAGNDTLTGGAGSDVLRGGSGNDTYVVDGSDTLTENSGAGTDTVQGSTSRTLASNFEHLVLTGGSAINGNGNTAANSITGNTGANTLTGFGANDTLSGGDGADSLLGGAGADSLTGGNAADTLKGGSERDTLTGGAGNDVFVFDTTAGSSHFDTITDFATSGDKIQLDDDIFTQFDDALSTTVDSDQFTSGAGRNTAQDAEDRLIYNTTTGALYYDADGNGLASSPVQIAKLGTTTHPSIGAGSFTIAD